MTTVAFLAVAEDGASTPNERVLTDEACCATPGS